MNDWAVVLFLAPFIAGACLWAAYLLGESVGRKKERADKSLVYDQLKPGNFMTMNDYQNVAHRTAIYPPETRVFYNALGLAGEAGEVANKIKKIYREKQGKLNQDDAREVALELGDVLWYAAEMCGVCGHTMGEVAAMNLLKLNKRKAEMQLTGSGDHRTGEPFFAKPGLTVVKPIDVFDPPDIKKINE